MLSPSFSYVSSSSRLGWVRPPRAGKPRPFGLRSVPSNAQTVRDALGRSASWRAQTEGANSSSAGGQGRASDRRRGRTGRQTSEQITGESFTGHGRSRDPPTLSERSSVWESLCERLYVYLYVFYGKITLLRKTDLYQIPPKPSPVEANPSPEHPGGTPVEPWWNPGGTRVEPRWNPGGIRKNPGDQKSHSGPPFLASKCQSRNNKQCFGQ